MNRFVLSIIVCLFAQNAFAEEFIRSYHQHLDLEKNGAMVVTETIEVNTEQIEFKRGLFRDFPRSKTTADAAQSSSEDFEMISASVDGAPVDYQTEVQPDRFRVRISGPQPLLSIGTHIFQLTYNARHQVRYFPEHTELFWNVTGNGWDFQIQKATAIVILPDDVVPIHTIAFTGPRGSKSRDVNISVDGNRVEFTTSQPLKEREGLTISIRLSIDALDPETAITTSGTSGPSGSAGAE